MAHLKKRAHSKQDGENKLNNDLKTFITCLTFWFMARLERLSMYWSKCHSSRVSMPVCREAGEGGERWGERTGEWETHGKEKQLAGKGEKLRDREKESRLRDTD